MRHIIIAPPQVTPFETATGLGESAWGASAFFGPAMRRTAAIALPQRNLSAIFRNASLTFFRGPSESFEAIVTGAPDRDGGKQQVRQRAPARPPPRPRDIISAGRRDAAC